MKRARFPGVALLALLAAAACGDDEAVEDAADVTDIEIATPGGASLDTVSPGILGAPRIAPALSGPGGATVEVPDSGATAGDSTATG